MIRVATYNTRHGRRPDGVVDLPLLAEACGSLGADVLALQEVRIGAVDPIALVAEASGLRGVFCHAVRSPRGDYGNALFVRGGIDELERVPFPGDTEPRSALVAELVVGDARLSVATGHLGLRGQALAELPVVVAALVARPRPWLLLGDLNLTLDQVVPIVSGHGLTAVDAGPTFPVSRPNRQIDHVATAGLEVAAVEVLRLPVSDHRALVVDLGP